MAGREIAPLRINNQKAVELQRIERLHVNCTLTPLGQDAKYIPNPIDDTHVVHPNGLHRPDHSAHVALIVERTHRVWPRHSWFGATRLVRKLPAWVVHVGQLLIFLDHNLAGLCHASASARRLAECGKASAVRRGVVTMTKLAPEGGRRETATSRWGRGGRGLVARRPLAARNAGKPETIKRPHLTRDVVVTDQVQGTPRSVRVRGNWLGPIKISAIRAHEWSTVAKAATRCGRPHRTFHPSKARPCGVKCQKA
mmetsp:Transcript_12802/g.32486  ORF Transcript_12802/g.32486 Transcript_12802/m.32486 type:complete len:254 (-) Transcript_12802:23-784(-)